MQKSRHLAQSSRSGMEELSIEWVKRLEVEMFVCDVIRSQETSGATFAYQGFRAE